MDERVTQDHKTPQKPTIQIVRLAPQAGEGNIFCNHPVNVNCITAIKLDKTLVGRLGVQAENVNVEQLPVSLSVFVPANRKEHETARKTSLTSLHHTQITHGQRQIPLCN